LQKIVLEGLETRRAGVRPKQNKRSPPGGGKDPKQCPGDARDMEAEIGYPKRAQAAAGLLPQME